MFGESDEWAGENGDSINSSSANLPPIDNPGQPDVQNVPAAPSWAEFQAMMQTMYTMNQQNQEFQATQRAMGRALEAMTDQVRNLTTIATTASRQSAPVLSAPSAGPVPSGTARFEKPRTFTGQTSEVEPFLAEIKNAIFLSANSLPTDHHKSAYLQSFLGKGTPKTWYTAAQEANPTIVDNFDALCQNFRVHFGDPDVSATALRKIQALKQTTSAANYFSRFTELLVHLDFSETTKIDEFRRGLKDEVKDIFLGVRPKPKTLIDYARLAIEIDNEVHTRNLEKSANKKSDHKPSPRSDHTTSQSRNVQYVVPVPSSSSTTLPPGVPMEIDATKTRRGPLTPEEKDRRRREGLCLYCGLGKHLVANCPNMSEKTKKRFAERAAAPASSGKA